MFLTFTPNPCIERTVRLPVLARGETQRVASESVFISAGGKGINAARVAAKCGARVMATAPIGRRQLGWLQELASSEGVANDFVPVEADTRFCINVVHGDGQKTEIIENGSPLSVHEGTLLLEKWRDLLPEVRLAAIGGSYPPAHDSGFDFHATLLCDLARRAGVPVLYDGTGEPFARALATKSPPWAIKPNLEEAAAYLKRDLDSVAAERRAVRDLLRKGVEVVLLSCGARGLYVGTQGGIEWFAAPRVEVVSPVGSGDSLVGAFAARWLETGDIFEAARWGVAAGSACASQEKPAFVNRADVELLLPQVHRTMQEISLPLLSS
jgi:tagatose 6-phosphate kinase